MQALRGSSLRSSTGLRAGSRSSTACRAATAIPPKVRDWIDPQRGPLPAPCGLPGAHRSRPLLAAGPAQFKGVKPAGDRVLVKVDKEEGKTQGGVLLPTVAQNKPTAGAVVELGDVELVQVGGGSWQASPPVAAAARARRRVSETCAAPMGVPAGAGQAWDPGTAQGSGHQKRGPQPPPRSPQSGDRVVYSKYAGIEVAIGGDEHVLLKVRRRGRGAAARAPAGAAAPGHGRAGRGSGPGPSPSPADACGGSQPQPAGGELVPRQHQRQHERKRQRKRHHRPPPPPPQEEDVIGVLPSGDNIAKLKPLGDRVLIKVRGATGKGREGRPASPR